MEPLQETYTLRTRDGREYPGLTLASMRIGATQKIFSLEDVVRPDKMAGTWTPLARILSLPDPGSLPPQRALAATPFTRPEDPPRVSTGIALDLDAHPPRLQPIAPPLRAPVELAPRIPSVPTLVEDDTDPTRHRLRIAGAYLLCFGILGMVAYALGKHGPTDSVIMLVNTGFGLTLLMNVPQARKWAVGWVIAGWALAGLGGTLSAGCFGLVIAGAFAGLGFGGPVCLLWGEECPRPRFWTGVTLMGIVLLLMVGVMILAAVAGAALLQRMHG